MNALPAPATRDLVYNKSGNLRKQQLGTTSHRIYVYDAWNRLRRVHNVIGATTTLFAEYKYNDLYVHAGIHGGSRWFHCAPHQPTFSIPVPSVS